MARRQPQDNGSWQLAESYLQQDDDRFVDEIRRITDGEALGNFAAKWYGDTRPQARRLMLVYLRRPLNAFRHEALVKRLFKIAEAAKDDELMAHFLVLLDRAVRRVRSTYRHFQQQTVSSRKEAEQLQAEWERLGAENVQLWRNRSRILGGGQGWTVQSFFPRERYQVPADSSMPRPYSDVEWRQPFPLSEADRASLVDSRLFSVATRNYLRRRAWRYFRQMGKTTPDRYVDAVQVALKLYQDSDVGDGVALLDNWGLMHVLFHHSSVLIPHPHGWRLDPEHQLSQLQPAPYFEELWKPAFVTLLELLKEGQCRPVRQWALVLLRRDHQQALQQLSLEALFAMLSTGAIEVVELAAELLKQRPDVEKISIDRWLKLLDTENVDLINVVCQLMQERLSPNLVSFEDAVRLAKSRALPIARLGFTWLRSQRPETAQECEALLSLAEAEAEALRVEMVQWARASLRRSPHFRPEWVLELLDSPHAAVRAEGWQWLMEGPRLRENHLIWQKLFESPYDDVRLLLVAELEDRVSRGDASWIERDQLDNELLRFLWASVLLNVHRGSRVKPLALQQVSRRLQVKTDEAEQLLPMLRIALRSIRGPEWRSALTRIVQVVEARPQLSDTVKRSFPELELI